MSSTYLTPTQPDNNQAASTTGATQIAQEVTALLPGLVYFPPCPPELAKPGLRPPVAR